MLGSLNRVPLHRKNIASQHCKGAARGCLAQTPQTSHWLVHMRPCLGTGNICSTNRQAETLRVVPEPGFQALLRYVYDDLWRMAAVLCVGARGLSTTCRSMAYRSHVAAGQAAGWSTGWPVKISNPE